MMDEFGGILFIEDRRNIDINKYQQINSKTSY